MIQTPTPRIIRLIMRGGAVLALAWLGSLINLKESPAPDPATRRTLPPGFVGQGSCSECHLEQTRLWQGSHHDLSMQEANEQSVLGHFNHETFNKDGIRTEFYRQNQRFMVRTEGEDGNMADFEIKYTFGVTPLQQYLIELPGGRLQALSIAWDSRPEAEGGQRWFHLYPDEKIDHHDELHWTRLSQNWNFMCAECHSTHLKKNYEEASHTYRTTWAEIDVACEACHGPGSEHVAIKRQSPGDRPADHPSNGLTVHLNERKGAQWVLNPISGSARREPPRKSSQEIETCAPCHSRRGQWFPEVQPGAPLMESYLPATLKEGLYHVDGQIDGEVYEYGSFLQSRMNHAGVTCSDCHDPHSLKLRATGNDLCLQCHAAQRFDTTRHHFHQDGSVASRCVECHMPAKHYMVVDPRRDHSFRIPRPDLSTKLGIPNACNQCHSDQSAEWAAKALRKWLDRDPGGYQDYAETLYAARRGSTDALSPLRKLLNAKDQPVIARATAAEALGQFLNPDTLNDLIKAMEDEDPWLRAAALQATDALPPEKRWETNHQRLRDPVRVVRALAAKSLADVPPFIQADGLSKQQMASEDYLAAQRFNADDPGSQVNLGNFLAAKGDLEGAEKAYREALAIDSGWIPALINLADLYRLQDQDQKGEALLREALINHPDVADLRYSLGLLLVRQKKQVDALPYLGEAAQLNPNNPQLSFVYAVALHSAGKKEEAFHALHKGLEASPDSSLLLDLKEEWQKGGSIKKEW